MEFIIGIGYGGAGQHELPLNLRRTSSGIKDVGDPLRGLTVAAKGTQRGPPTDILEVKTGG